MGGYNPPFYFKKVGVYMAKNKPLTKKEKLEREYNKQIRRIEKRKKELESLGYVTSDIKIRQKPKRVTEATIRHLKKITPSFIREHARIVSFETGEVANPKTKSSKRIKQENAILAIENVKSVKTPKSIKFKKVKEGYQPPSMDDRIIDNFLSLMSQLPIPVYDVIKKAVYRQIGLKGKGAVAEAIQFMPEQMQNSLLASMKPSDGAIIEFDTYLYQHMPLTEEEKQQVYDEMEDNSWDDYI